MAACWEHCKYVFSRGSVQSPSIEENPKRTTVGFRDLLYVLRHSYFCCTGWGLYILYIYMHDREYQWIILKWWVCTILCKGRATPETMFGITHLLGLILSAWNIMLIPGVCLCAWLYILYNILAFLYISFGQVNSFHNICPLALCSLFAHKCNITRVKGEEGG